MGVWASAADRVTGVPEGELAIVLHTHMPYVESGGTPWPEGFGTWPFGEEWLWEAIATSYLPLLEVLDAHEPGAGHAEPHARAVRSAGGARSDRAVRALPARDPARVAPA